MPSHYETLKIPRTASKSEIKSAYRKQRSEHHPDRNPDPLSNQRMQLINEAYAILSDPAKRKIHDADLEREAQLADFFRKMEEDVVGEEFVSTEAWDDEPTEEKDTEKTDAMQRYFEMLGASWVAESIRSVTYSRIEPTYRVFRTDFTVGNKIYYFYACYKSEIVGKWNQVERELEGEAHNYSSGTLSPRLANQSLMDEIFQNKGVLWSDGEPHGDVTGAFFRKG